MKGNTSGPDQQPVQLIFAPPLVLMKLFLLTGDCKKRFRPSKGSISAESVIKIQAPRGSEREKATGNT